MNINDLFQLIRCAPLLAVTIPAFMKLFVFLGYKDILTITTFY